MLGIFSRKGNRLRLDDYAVEFFPPSAASEDHWLELTRDALTALAKRIRGAIGSVVLVLPPHLALTKLIKTPRVDPAKREKIIRFEAEQNIPYALSDVVWDSVVVGERAIDFEIMLVAAKLDAVVPLCAAVQAVGFQPRAILPAPLATLAGFRQLDTGSQPALILNLGARSTTLLLTDEKRFVARSLSLGGNGVTQHIAESQHCDPDEAEATKVSERSTNLTTAAMESLAARLAQEITRSVLHFKRQSDLEQPARVYLTGGAAQLARLADALAAKLKVPVERLDCLGLVEIGSAAGRTDLSEHALAVTDLIGAAITQLRADQLTLNLLPPTLRGHENLRQRQPWLIAAAVLAVAALVPPVWHGRNLNVEAKIKSVAVESEVLPLRLRDARLRENLQQLEALKLELAQLCRVYDRRASWLNLFADLQQRVVSVEDVWLEKLQVMPSTTADAPVKLIISGRMLDQANPLSKVSPETYNRVKTLLASFVESPFVATIEGERFDNNQPGILQFDFVLVADPQRPL